MTPDQETRLRLRALVGESVDNEAGETAADTLFQDEEIDEILTISADMPNAKLEAWERKAARLANLVDIAEGTSRRSLSQMHAHAMQMVASSRAATVSGGGTPSTRVHRIARRRPLRWPW